MVVRKWLCCFSSVRQAVFLSFDKIATLICPRWISVDVVVTGTADTQPPLGGVEAGLPASTAMVYLRRGCEVTTFATRTSGEILLAEFRVSDLLLFPFLGYGINSLTGFPVKATVRLH